MIKGARHRTSAKRRSNQSAEQSGKLNREAKQLEIEAKKDLEREVVGRGCKNRLLKRIGQWTLIPRLFALRCFAILLQIDFFIYSLF